MTEVVRRWLVLVVAAVLAGASGCRDSNGGSDGSTGPGPKTTAERVDELCSTCHYRPPPDALPRHAWRAKIETMFEIVKGSEEQLPDDLPSIDDAVARFEKRAPERLEQISHTVDRGAGGLDLRPSRMKVPPGKPPFPAMSSARFVRISDAKRLDLLVCDMRFGTVSLIRPWASRETVLPLGQIPGGIPCAAEIVDLDGNGSRDLVVSDLGTVTPSDVPSGKLWWFRGRRGKPFEIVRLLGDVGRIAHSGTADFDGDGDLDIVVAVFGWRRLGQILMLRNDTKDWSKPRFSPFQLDPRSGAIHIRILDLDEDGHLDFVTLLSQQHEAVVAFLGDGKGGFRVRELYRAPHPNWGSTGIQIVDMDGDGDVDILYSNGDTLDDLIPKPYHGVQWLENRGRLVFEHHHVTNLYGCNAAKAVDMDGDGDLDIVACAFLPDVRPDTKNADLTESLIWLEQVAPGKFERWSLETVDCFHPTLDAADFDADGDVDIVVGNFTMGKTRPGPIDSWYTLWENARR